ncbi:hypothetical protein KRR55_05980 [Paeniglutamicibacter sp. ABSL32-1]|uniref:hypothetical protein n=1 Tax=Paeniglutamicibacter quisquiliarum TaxID=2849498 RepID=UPI001C2D2B37|nr:hypothetical protein [Paeniglutamicibacter quisquiliarum]MBV1778660.1 hypothetical protein [Paeniglutamicibacter quisquiliarum]
MLLVLATTGWFNPDMDSDTFNTGLGDMIGSLLAGLFSLAQPLFSAVGFVVILFLIIRAIFRKRR